MGQIREDFILTDAFSATFSKFLQLGKAATNRLSEMADGNTRLSGTAEDAARQSRELYDTITSGNLTKMNVSEIAEQELAGMRRSLAAMQTLYNAQTQRLVAQRAQVEALARSYDELKQSKDASEAATNRAAQALSRAQMRESAMMRQATRTAEQISRQNQEIDKFSEKMAGAETATKKTADAQNRHRREVQATNSSLDKMLSTARNIAVVFAAFKIGGSIVRFSDDIIQTEARLKLMLDEGQSFEQLQEDIYQSAQRTRASYSSTADTIAKMGLNAGHAFANNKELIAFMEAVNMQFAIGGAGAAQMEGAMLQLTQAMGAGALRGEELNSILDAAPGIARNIERYMGWAQGSIKQYAEQGLVSSQIVKAAMLNSLDDIRDDFNQMPQTSSQIWNRVSNAATMAFRDVGRDINDLLNMEEVQDGINVVIASFDMLADVASSAVDVMADGAVWVHDNWDAIFPFLIGGFAAVGGAAAMAGVSAVAAWAAATWPILLVAAGIGTVIYLLQRAGMSWEEMGANAGGSLAFLAASIYNLIAFSTNGFIAFAEFFVNVWNNPATAVANLFHDLFDGILGMVETAAHAIDALLGTSLASGVSGFRDRLSDFVTQAYGENEIKLTRMEEMNAGDMIREWSDFGGNLGKKLDNLNLNVEDILGGVGDMFDFSGLATNGIDSIGNVGSVDSVKNVDGDIRLSDEDIRFYSDLAERRYMNQIELQTLAPNISVSIAGAEAKNITPQDIADKLKAMLIQQQAAHTVKAHG